MTSYFLPCLSTGPHNIMCQIMCCLITAVLESFIQLQNANKGANNENWKAEEIEVLLSCQPRVTVTSCFVYRGLSIDRSLVYKLRISDLSIRVSSSGVYKIMVYLTIVNKILRHCPSWLAGQCIYWKGLTNGSLVYSGNILHSQALIK